ncbi:MAG: hypothetical protein ABSA76_14140, partial [Bacteroidales bacterium]
KFDIQSIMISRSFLGNGFLSKPLISELLLSALIILLFYRKGQIKKPLLADFRSGIVNSLWFISFPVITGLCLFTFKQEYYFRFQFNEMLLLRWLYFVLTFVAVNKIININPFHRFWRVFFIILILILTSFLQDFTSNSEADSTILATLSGVGLTQAFSIIAYRNTYKNSFWAGLFSAMFTGLISCFFIFGAVSGSYFTLVFPSVALLLAAISMYNKSLKHRIISLCSISLLSLLFSLFLPSLFPPKYGDLLRENKKVKTKYQERAYGIQINYNDTTVRRSLTQIAKVLQAANQVSRDNFGISPDIKWITIYGIEQGGFNAVYPQGIEGNFLSQQYLNLIHDSTFLNNPDYNCQFPDPVNSLLHEYSHLFGVFPYQKWMRTESEGWATYSATRLSKLIFQKYGASLWPPSYNYAKIADSINASLLAEHPLVWSHPEEVGSFKMWNSYEQKAGLQNVYKNRWQYTSRDKNAIFIRENKPYVINDFINAKIGKASFNQVLNIPSGKFEELYKPNDWKIFFRLINVSDDEINKHIGLMKAKEININVPGPKNNSSILEIVLIISSLLLFLVGRFALKNNS